MAGGRTCCCFGVVLLLGLCLHDVETSGCSKIIRAPVGGKVVLPSCLSPEGVTLATWMFKGIFPIAVLDKENPPTQFRGRGEMCSNYSLILTKLTHEDSGNYSFVSEVNGRQRGTTIITLHVYDPITGPVLTANTSLTVNGSCSVVLKCNSSSDSIKSYTWTVKNRTSSGSHEMQYFISPQDGETKFTCTIKTSDAEMSVSRTEKCSNDTSLLPEESGQNKLLRFLIAGVVAALLAVFVVTTVICVCVHKKRRQAGSELNDVTVYADITEVMQDVTPCVMKPCSVYETIDVTDPPQTSGPKTVYDNVQFKYMKRTSEAADPQR